MVVIDPAGVRPVFLHGPGPGTTATRSSPAAALSDAARRALSEP